MTAAMCSSGDDGGDVLEPPRLLATTVSTNPKRFRSQDTYPLELRKLLRVDLLIIDDLALQPLDQTETQDLYETVVERHRVSSTIVTSTNREPGEWLDAMADPMLAQSAVDRLQ